METYNDLKHVPTLLKIYVLVINAIKYLYVKVDVKGLSKMSILAILLIYYMPGINQFKVAKTLGLDKTTAGRLLLKLEKTKYIKRTQDPENKRSNLLETTKIGNELVEKMAMSMDKYVKQIEEGLSREEMAMLTKFVEVLLINSTKNDDFGGI